MSVSELRCYALRVRRSIALTAVAVALGCDVGSADGAGRPGRGVDAGGCLVRGACATAADDAGGVDGGAAFDAGAEGGVTGDRADAGGSGPLACDAAACISPRYTDNGDGTVTSGCCALVWQQRVDPQLAGHADAAKYCADLALHEGGWRLPAIAELHSLVVLGQTPENPTIDRSAFPDVPTEVQYWSSTPFAGSPGTFWSVSFYNGRTSKALGTLGHRICVR
jgi:hypothetical protein